MDMHGTNLLLPMSTTLPSPVIFRCVLSTLALLLAVNAQAQQAEAFREWTSSDGRKLEAALIAVDGDAVKLKMRNGSVVPVPLNRLSADDQAFAKKAAPAPSPTGNPAAPAEKPTNSVYAAEKTWPRSVALSDVSPVTVVKEDSDKKEFIYRSEHYEFQCDSKLGANVVREFNRIFEATHLLNCKLPLDFRPEPEQGQEYFVAKIYTSKDDYLANGGVAGSAGVYQSGKKSLSVPLSSLGVKMVGSRVSVEKSKEEHNAVLIHEITHQMMNHWLPHLPTWYIEGSARYTEVLKYDHGKFNLANMDALLRAHMQHHSDGKHYTMLDLEELTNLDGRTWAAALTSTNHQAGQNYTSAMLLTYYFYHLDDKGDAAHMMDYLKAVQNTRDKVALEAAFKQHLLRERSFEALKNDVKKAMRKSGLDLDFSSPGKNKPPSASAS